MIGNDVVDLACDETRPGAQHPRFDARVFAVSERLALARSDAPELWRWLFWSAKESAYKLARRMDPKVVFSPRRFEVNLGADLRGRVCWPGGECVVQVEHDSRRVHAVAARDEDALAGARVKVAPIDCIANRGAVAPGHAARALAIDDLAPRLGIAPSALEVRRARRIPALFANERAIAWSLSLSHHGRFAAFAALPTGARA